MIAIRDYIPNLYSIPTGEVWASVATYVAIISYHTLIGS